MNVSTALLHTLMTLAVSLGACSTQAVVLPSGQTQQTADVENTGPETGAQSADAQDALFLSWDKPSDSVSGYKIYFTDAEKKSTGGKLVKTVLKSAGQDTPTSAKVPLTALGQQTDSGKEVCFYLIAESGGKSSEPSESACIAL